MGARGPLTTQLLALIAVAGAAACHQAKPAAVPGETGITVDKVEIVAADGSDITTPIAELLPTLGLRVDSMIFPGRDYNPYRLKEDHRRVLAFFHLHGRYDAEVREPILEFNDSRTKVTVKHVVTEGVAYRIGSVQFKNAPSEQVPGLERMLPFGPGDPINTLIYRPFRRKLAEQLQYEGYGHARVYSRAFVDRATKRVDWFYYVDAGPRTRIGSIEVEGNRKISEDDIRHRLGIKSGDAYSTAAKQRAEFALLDTGAFASAVVISDADIQRGPPEHPDSGGVLPSERITADGNLVPRELDGTLELKVRVVEAPSRQFRMEVGVEADPTRVDSFVGSRLWLRNLLGSRQHFVVEGRVGYGYLFEQDRNRYYGDALARYVIPALTGKLDGRLTGTYRDSLLPTSALRQASVGPGVRATIDNGLFFDLDAAFSYARQLDLGTFDAMEREAFSLSETDSAKGMTLESRVILDRRNDGIEATRGHYASLRALAAPGGAVGTHRYVQVAPEARGFVGLSQSWSLGVRSAAAWTVLGGDTGVPTSARLFGGGAYGMRGFGRQALATTACAMDSAMGCDEEVVGGLSLFEGSVEARYLPNLQLYGLTAFADVGGVGPKANPFSDGISAAVGFGARIRTWYVPIAIDFSYRAVEENSLTKPDSIDPFLVFFRIGEAF